MKVQKIKKSWMVANAYRIDAPFHLSDGVITKLQLESCPFEKTTLIAESKELYKGNIHRRVYVDSPDCGYPFMTASDMFKADLNSGKFVSKKYSPYVNELTLKKDWIVITRSGTLGKVLYTNADFEGKFGTDDLIRINPSEKKVKRGFLYAFLKSRFGYSLLTQSGYGGVVKHIEPEHIRNMPIPILPDKIMSEIHHLVIDAARFLEESKALLNEAITTISDSIPNPKAFSNTQTGMRNITIIGRNYQKRIDSIAYINKGVEYMEYVTSDSSFKTIKEFGIQVTRPGIFKRTYVSQDSGIPYIKGAELALQNPFSSCVYLSKTKTPFLNELKLRINQILFTCAGTIGNTRLITKEFEEEEAIGSQDIIRINCSKSMISPQYLFAYLRIPIVKEFIQSLKYGSVIERVEPFHVETIPVFIPSQILNEKVTDIIARFSELEYKAFKNEQMAVKLLETEIDSWQN